MFVARPSGGTSETAGIKASQLHLEAGLNGARILWEDSYSSAFARSATLGASTESQVIVPSYVTGTDEIFVAQIASTGVSLSGTELKLIDINADGRAWAKQ